MTKDVVPLEERVSQEGLLYTSDQKIINIFIMNWRFKSSRESQAGWSEYQEQS